MNTTYLFNTPSEHLSQLDRNFKVIQYNL